MKTRLTIVGGVALLLASALQSFAIEGLQLSLQCSNVVLRWPSVAGDAYFVRYRPDLTTNSSWTILTNAYPAANGTNMTYFVHSNAVLNPNCGGNGGGGSGGTNNPPPPPRPGAMTLTGTSALTANSPPPRPPYPWEATNRPSATSSMLLAAGAGAPSGGSPINGQVVGIGFYEVVKVGIHLFGVTNGMVLSGTVPLKFEFANGDTNGVLDSVSVVNTNDLSFPFGETVPDLSSASNCVLGFWDTGQASNGVYFVQATATLNDGTIYLDHPVTVTVSNLVSFVDPYPVGGLAVYVGAKTVFTNGTWHLDIYNDQNQHLGSISGSVDGNGWCAYPGVAGPGFSLNNTDTNGNQLPSTFYSLAMKTTSPDGSKSAAKTNITWIEKMWSLPLAATLAYVPIFQSGSQGDMDQQTIMNGAYTAENQLGTVVLQPPPNNLQPFPIGTPTDWSTVIANLSDTLCREFFYTGEGGAGALGNANNPARTASFNIVLRNDPEYFPYRTNTHQYRFVFLWGCNTADGRWPETFGIPHQQMTIADFAAVRGILPRAFIGWTGLNKSVNWKGTFAQGHIQQSSDFWMNYFWQNWLVPGVSLTNAITAATVDPNGVAGNHDFSLATNGLTIYGAVDLISDQ